MIPDFSAILARKARNFWKYPAPWPSILGGRFGLGGPRAAAQALGIRVGGDGLEAAANTAAGDSEIGRTSCSKRVVDDDHAGLGFRLSIMSTKRTLCSTSSGL